MVRALRSSLACAALLGAACGPTPIVVDAPQPEPPPPPEPVAVVAPGPARVLQVAGDVRRERRIVTVPANSPRTPIGHFLAGQRVRISVLDARWTSDPGQPFRDARGVPGTRCLDGGRTCVGGDGAAPLMGLILVQAPVGVSAAPAEATCAPRHRIFVPHGVEFAVPEETELSLAPNDWDDDLANNSGALRVDVETASGPRARASGKVRVEVDARRARTSLGRFHAGQYVRISVAGGRWSHDGAAAAVDAAGALRVKCASSPGHACLGGDTVAPLMGLMLLVGPCGSQPPRPALERRYIPEGIELTVIRESDLFLGPNDWEDGCADNAGAAMVEVESEAR
jgi:hypothetical protein